MSSQNTLIDWLSVELDKRLAREPSDAARVDVLNEQVAVWSQRRARFIFSDGDSESPHPLFGLPTMTDMTLTVCMLHQRLSEFEAQMEFA